MKRLLQFLSATIFVVAVAVWLLSGANCGWTKTSIPVRTLDAVTGIEGIYYQKHFVPGVDFLAVALVVSVVLGGVSLLYKRPRSKA